MNHKKNSSYLYLWKKIKTFLAKTIPNSTFARHVLENKHSINCDIKKRLKNIRYPKQYLQYSSVLEVLHYIQNDIFKEK